MVGVKDNGIAYLVVPTRPWKIIQKGEIATLSGEATLSKFFGLPSDMGSKKVLTQQS